MSALQAADVILDGIRRGEWRILIGEDAHVLDRMVRESPETAYEASFVREVTQKGHMRGLV